MHRETMTSEVLTTSVSMLIRGRATAPTCLTFDGRQPTTKDMTTRDVSQRLQGGFIPFKLRTSDGCEFNVPHREFIFVTERRVVVATPDGYVNVLDPLHIVSIEEAKPLPVE